MELGSYFLFLQEQIKDIIIDLLVHVTVRHNFKGTGHNGQTQGQLRNPDNPDHRDDVVNWYLIQ